MYAVRSVGSPVLSSSEHAQLLSSASTATFSVPLPCVIGQDCRWPVRLRRRALVSRGQNAPQDGWPGPRAPVLHSHTRYAWRPRSSATHWRVLRPPWSRWLAGRAVSSSSILCSCSRSSPLRSPYSFLGSMGQARAVCRGVSWPTYAFCASLCGCGSASCSHTRRTRHGVILAPPASGRALERARVGLASWVRAAHGKHADGTGAARSHAFEAAVRPLPNGVGDQSGTARALTTTLATCYLGALPRDSVHVDDSAAQRRGPRGIDHGGHVPVEGSRCLASAWVAWPRRP